MQVRYEVNGLRKAFKQDKHLANKSSRGKLAMENKKPYKIKVML